jgi:hypothetical protein
MASAKSIIAAAGGDRKMKVMKRLALIFLATPLLSVLIGAASNSAVARPIMSAEDSGLAIGPRIRATRRLSPPYVLRACCEAIVNAATYSGR